MIIFLALVPYRRNPSDRRKTLKASHFADGREPVPES